MSLPGQLYKRLPKTVGINGMALGFHKSQTQEGEIQTAILSYYWAFVIYGFQPDFAGDELIISLFKSNKWVRGVWQYPVFTDKKVVSSIALQIAQG